MSPGSRPMRRPGNLPASTSNRPMATSATPITIRYRPSVPSITILDFHGRSGYFGLKDSGERTALFCLSKIQNLLKDFRGFRADVGGAADDVDARLRHGRHLLGRGALAAGDDRAGMAHAAARRRGLPADEADDPRPEL